MLTKLYNATLVNVEVYNGPIAANQIITSRILEFCLRNGHDIPAPLSESFINTKSKLGSDFAVNQDVPKTFASLLSGLAYYEKGGLDKDRGVWRGWVEWLWLTGVTIKDPRIDEIITIFGGRRDVAARGVSSFSEPVLTFPITEGVAVRVHEWNDADEPFAGAGKTVGTEIGFRLPRQNIDEKAEKEKQQMRREEFAQHLREGALPKALQDFIDQEGLRKLFE